MNVSFLSSYNELMMLEVEYKPLKMSVGGRDSIYMLQEKAEDSQILSCYQLPDKIVSFRRHNVVKSSDLKIRAGTFLDTDIKQVINHLAAKTWISSWCDVYISLLLFRLFFRNSRWYSSQMYCCLPVHFIKPYYYMEIQIPICSYTLCSTKNG